MKRPLVLPPAEKIWLDIKYRTHTSNLLSYLVTQLVTANCLLAGQVHQKQTDVSEIICYLAGLLEGSAANLKQTLRE